MAWIISNLETQLPGARAAHSCDIIGNKIYIFGGWNGKKALNDLHILNLPDMTWRVPQIQGKLPVCRNNHTTAVVGDKIFIHGGHDGSRWLDDLYILDTVQIMTWIRPNVQGNPPSARACHTMSRVGRRLYLFGGYDGLRCFNVVEILDLDTMTWAQPMAQGNVPLARNAHTMSVVGTKLYLFGGHSGNRHLKDLHVLDTETMIWTEPDVFGSPPNGLRGHTACVIGKKIFIFGGYDGRGRSNDLYTLDYDKFNWSHPIITEEAPAGRQRHTACNVGNKQMFIFGGFDGNKWLNDIYILDIAKLEESTIARETVNSLISNLKSMINNPLMSDISFIVQDCEIYAHKCILVSQSAHFKAMFLSGMNESQLRTITIHDWSYDSYLMMMEFLYTGNINNFTVNTAIEVIGLADAYTLDGLKRLCENCLIHNIEIDNACDLLIVANIYSAFELKKYAMNFIVKNFRQVNATAGFEGLEQVPNLLIEITRAVFSKHEYSQAQLVIEQQMSIGQIDLYSVLNVDQSATPEQILQSYYKLSAQIPNDDSWIDKFDQIQTAKDVLTNPKQRQIYDRLGFSGLKLSENTQDLVRSDMAGFNHKIKKHIGSLYKEEAYVIINPKLLSVIECEVNEQGEFSLNSAQIQSLLRLMVTKDLQMELGVIFYTRNSLGVSKISPSFVYKLRNNYKAIAGLEIGRRQYVVFGVNKQFGQSTDITFKMKNSNSEQCAEIQAKSWLDKSLYMQLQLQLGQASYTRIKLNKNFHRFNFKPFARFQMDQTLLGFGIDKRIDYSGTLKLKTQFQNINSTNFKEVINEIGVLLASSPNNCFYFGFSLSISDMKIVIEFTRGGLRVKIPISIIQKKRSITDVLIQAGISGIGSYLAFKTIRKYFPDKNPINMKEIREQRDKLHEYYDSFVQLIKNKINKNQSLVIKRAWYGNESDIGQNLKSEEVLDVTEILQFMVKENSLKLPQSTKQNIPGFYNPCLDPSVQPVLLIDYCKDGQTISETVKDNEVLII